MSRYNVEKDKQEANRAMRKFLIDNGWLQDYFKAQTIHILEETNAKQGLQYDLDMFADCDLLLKLNDGYTSLIGAGVKLQKNGDFRTFLLRYWKNSTGWDTEYPRLVHNIKMGHFYPQILIHGYYDQQTDEMLSLAMIRTKDLIELMEYNNRSNCVIKDGIYESDGYQSKMIFIKWHKIPEDLFLYKWSK